MESTKDGFSRSEGKNVFKTYQMELDQRNDRHERIVKSSRDVTIESKKIIFQLHRLSTKKTDDDKNELLSNAAKRLDELRKNQLLKVAKEMTCVMDQYMHNRAITFGIQEHIEASTFYKFIRSGELLTFEEMQSLLTFEEDGEEEAKKKIRVEVTPSDYLMGLSDVGGELMRYAINQSSAGNWEVPLQVVRFMRPLYRGYLLQNPLVQHKDFSQKLNVFRQSLMKVENVLYLQKLKVAEFADENIPAPPSLISCVD